MAGDKNNRSLLNHTLMFIVKLLNDNNVSNWFIGYGTLLGIIRENSCIAGDDDVDIIIDATDNFKSRSLINKISLFLKKPLVMGAAIKMQGQVAVFRNDLSDMPCYNCLYDDIEDEINSCIDLGVLSTLTGMIGSLQATEVIKTLIGFGESLESKLLLVDLKYMSFRTVKIIKDNKCKVCN